jgi:hypothetical protein
MKLSNEFIEYMMSEIKNDEGEDWEKRCQLEKIFADYDDLMDCTLFFQRESKKKGIAVIRLSNKLKELGVDVDKVMGSVTTSADNSTVEGLSKLIDYQTKLKNGYKIAYKQHASVEKCVELYTKYHNIQKVADELGVNHMTVRRRLKSAGL